MKFPVTVPTVARASSFTGDSEPGRVAGFRVSLQEARPASWPGETEAEGLERRSLEERQDIYRNAARLGAPHDQDPDDRHNREPATWQRDMMYHDLPTGQRYYLVGPKTPTTAVMLRALHGFKMRSLPPVSVCEPSYRASMRAEERLVIAVPDSATERSHCSQPRLVAPHSLHLLLYLPCAHMLASWHALHLRLPLPCAHMLAPPALRALVPLSALRANARAPERLALVPHPAVSAYARAPRTPCTRSSACRARICWRPRTPCTRSSACRACICLR